MISTYPTSHSRNFLCFFFKCTYISPTFFPNERHKMSSFIARSSFHLPRPSGRPRLIPYSAIRSQLQPQSGPLKRNFMTSSPHRTTRHGEQNGPVSREPDRPLRTSLTVVKALLLLNSWEVRYARRQGRAKVEEKDQEIA